MDYEARRGAGESALAARWYQRRGGLDLHGFGRWGQHTGASAGAALAWVVTDELELHASARALQRRDGWTIDGAAAGGLVATNPWRQATLGGASQWLLGASWAGTLQQSLLVEWWRDGSALSDAAWTNWVTRNQALTALQGPPAIAIAGNLAWQATPFAASSLRRDNLFLRAAWQPDHWLFSVDALVTPRDRGCILTAALQWQGDRIRVNAALRAYGGPGTALLAQLPQRRVGLVAASWAF
jgi:hypothetical protein